MRTGEQVVYFALQPPAEAADVARRVAGEVAARRRLSGALVPAHRLHVSLCGLGRFAGSPSGPVIRIARQVGRQIAARPFRVAFNRLGTWGRGRGVRPIVLWGDEGGIGAELLHESLRRGLVTAGLPQRPPGLQPHMTLLRDRIEAPTTFVPAISWWVGEFVLLNSHFGEGRVEVLDRFPLGGERRSFGFSA